MFVPRTLPWPAGLRTEPSVFLGLEPALLLALIWGARLGLRCVSYAQSCFVYDLALNFG